MSKKWVAFAFGVMLSACQTTTLSLPDDNEIRASEHLVVDEQEIVVISPSWASARVLVSRAAPLGYRLKAEDELDGLNLVMLTMLIPAGQDGGSAIRELESLQSGMTAGVNHAYSPQSEGTNRARHYASELLEWQTNGCPARLSIGVLDTGMDATVQNQFGVNHADFSRYKSEAEDTGHATAIMDLLLTSGMLHDLEVYHADVVSNDDQLGDVASVDSILRGLNWLIQQDVRLINVSLAGPYNKILDRAFQRAAQEGTIVVAAAGNAGPTSRVQYPAGFSSTIAVTAIDANSNIYSKATHGASLDFSAPGVDVFISDLDGGHYRSGTSIAAPFVTLRIAGDPVLAGQKNVKDVRSSLSKDVRDLGKNGHDPIFGFGLIAAPPPCRGSE